MHIAPEHELEPERGLPERLPAGERLLWQGSPDWKALAVRAFHVRTLAVYFAILLLVSGGMAASDAHDLRSSVVTLATFGFLAAVALVILAALAWLAARTTVYTVTDKRVVMRIGIVLSATFNLPFSRIGAASVGATAGDKADIALALAGPDRIGYGNLWPHARPWHVRRTEPMLRAVPEGARVAALLARAWSESRGLPLLAGAAPSASAAPSSSAPAASPGTSARPLGFPLVAADPR